MTRAVGSMMLAAGLAAGMSACTRTAPVASLPYYADATFSPGWSGTTHRVGSFSFVSQTGARVRSTDLAGRPYVASFIYTRCTSICPQLVSGLKRVVAAVTDPRLTVLSFSVTPDLDTPTVLAAFGRERGIDPARWKLLTGDRVAIMHLARDSFFADDDRLRASLDGPDAFLHTEKVVLVDGQGQLRGVYNGSQRADLDHLVEDANALLTQSGRGK